MVAGRHVVLGWGAGRLPLSAVNRVGVLFGGPSVEHDVSIITAQQVMAVAAERREVIPLYLAADGRLWTGESLRDVGSFATQPPSGARPI